MNDSRICECIRRTGVGAGPDGEQILKLNEGKCIEREIWNKKMMVLCEMRMRNRSH